MRKFLAALLAFGLLANANAQSTTWDSFLSNTQWYVPAENLLAYFTSDTDLTDTLAVADQTIWSIGDCTSGVFSGTSTATFKVGSSTLDSTTTMNGLITDSGQLRIAFTSSDSNTTTTIGIGQIRNISDVNYVEMQMMTGSGFYITHWAYMNLYDGDPETLPPLELQPEFLSPEWAWMDGSVWALDCDELFGEGEQGQFTVEDYDNGYFWGSGTGPTGSEAETFTLIGSATPEGNVLFNVLSGTTLTNLTGQISGDANTGAMVLRSYLTTESFTTGAAQVVPEPAPLALIAAAFLGAAAWRKRRRTLSASAVRDLSPLKG